MAAPRSPASAWALARLDRAVSVSRWSGPQQPLAVGDDLPQQAHRLVVAAALAVGQGQAVASRSRLQARGTGRPLDRRQLGGQRGQRRVGVVPGCLGPGLGSRPAARVSRGRPRPPSPAPAPGPGRRTGVGLAVVEPVDRGPASSLGGGPAARPAAGRRPQRLGDGPRPGPGPAPRPPHRPGRRPGRGRPDRPPAGPARPCRRPTASRSSAPLPPASGEAWASLQLPLQQRPAARPGSPSRW